MIDDSTSQPTDDPSLGRVLADAREARGLSVEDVAAATRIRAQLIGQIERDDFDGCGGAIYARGHIRAIAHVVDADAEELVARFDRVHGGPPERQFEPGALPRLSAGADRDIARARRRSPRWASAAVAVLAVGAVFLVATWFAGRSGGGPQRTAGNPVSVAPPVITPSPTPTPTPSPTPTSTPTPSPTPQQGVSVQVQVTGGRSWIQVRSGTGEEIFARILDDGQSMRWHDPQTLTLKFGNAPVVHVIVNGHDRGVPCTRTVCTVRFPPAAVAG
ncbi:MAG TPA: helix-turn-helix domain-containing protein [Mycobacteriales bacterium]|nr:helix-turn-helix domain-containing protein [Mycobacteriales bacterium]